MTTSYQIFFMDEDGVTVLKDVQSLNFGERPVPPENPSKEPTEEYDYVFEGWIDQNGRWLKEDTLVDQNLMYVAKYEEREHNYITVTEKIVKATCEEDGLEYQKCSNCSVERTIVIPKRNHIWEEIIEKEPTCTENGMKTQICTHNKDEEKYFACNVVKTEVTIPALGHQCHATNIARSENALRRGAIFKCIREGCEYEYSLYFQNKTPIVNLSELPEILIGDRDYFIDMVLHIGADETKSSATFDEKEGNLKLE